MQRGSTGRYEITSVGGERIRAFIPQALPLDPPMDLSNARQRLLEQATLALGRLDSITLLLPDPNIFLYAYVARNPPASFAERKTGSAARARAMPISSRLRRLMLRTAWPRWKASSMTSTPLTPCWSRPLLLTFSSRRSIHFSTATVGLAACSSLSSCTTVGCSLNHCFT